MNIWLGAFGVENMPDFPIVGLRSPPWRVYQRLSDLVDPGPTMTALFWDQREDTINTGNFGIRMNGWPDSPEETEIGDLPSMYHGRAGGLSFANGHAEIRRWRDSRTMPPLVKGKVLTFNPQQPNNVDIVWLQKRATRKINP